MNKISSIFVAFLMLSMVMGSASAATLNLVTKNTQTWNHEGTGLVVLEYNEIGADFAYKLNGVVTLPNTEYTLMYYIDQEPTGTPASFVNPGVPGQVITTVTSDINGNVAKTGLADILSMPFTTDPNGAAGENGGYPGAKIWLVPTSDISGTEINWPNMGNFLYEENREGAIKGVPSHLISYTVGTYSTTSEVETGANLGVCGVPSIGLTASIVDFGKLYAGEFATANLGIGVEEIVDPNCARKDAWVSVTVTPGAWTPTADIVTTVDETIKSVMVTTTASLNFVLNAAVGSNVPAGSYTEVITVSATY